MNASTAIALAALVYLTIGLFMALRFHRCGQSATAATAVFTWPLLLESTTDALQTRAGPFTPIIRKRVADLREALHEPGIEGLFDDSDIQRIELALYTADARVGTVDRLLADVDVRETTEGARLQAARDRSAAEVTTVIKGLVQLRVQLGLVALAGETGPVRDRLAELSARLNALEELTPGP